MEYKIQRNGLGQYRVLQDGRVARLDAGVPVLFLTWDRAHDWIRDDKTRRRKHAQADTWVDVEGGK